MKLKSSPMMKLMRLMKLPMAILPQFPITIPPQLLKKLQTMNTLRQHMK